MRNISLAVATATLATTTAYAGGLDRSGENIGILFEKGNYAELSFGSVKPSVGGKDAAAAGGATFSGVGKDYTQVGLGLKMDLNEQLSAALYYDQPYGVDIAYPTTSVMFGRTAATLESDALNLMLRYKFNENFSIHGGVRHQKISAKVTLAGAGYGAPGGVAFAADFRESTGTGYAIGAAYERPEIAMRVAVTYFSSVDHKLDTYVGGAFTGTSPTKGPEAINLDFQTGIAEGTLLFGQIRHAKWGDVDLVPAALGSDLINLDDSTSYMVGVGRQFTDKLSGSLSVSYEPSSSNDLVSALGPNNGRWGVTLGGRYKVSDQLTLSGGVNYTKLGNAQAKTGAGTAGAAMRDNESVGVGFKIGYHF